MLWHGPSVAARSAVFTDVVFDGNVVNVSGEFQPSNSQERIQIGGAGVTVVAGDLLTEAVLGVDIRFQNVVVCVLHQG